MTQPKFRGDIKGSVKANIADFESMVRNEIAHSAEFVGLLEDTQAFAEYKDLLTAAEMRAAFKRAFK